MSLLFLCNFWNSLIFGIEPWPLAQVISIEIGNEDRNLSCPQVTQRKDSYACAYQIMRHRQTIKHKIIWKRRHIRGIKLYLNIVCVFKINGSLILIYKYVKIVAHYVFRKRIKIKKGDNGKSVLITRNVYFNDQVIE